jgi:hypothetical protein
MFSLEISRLQAAHDMHQDEPVSLLPPLNNPDASFGKHAAAPARDVAVFGRDNASFQLWYREVVTQYSP